MITALSASAVPATRASQDLPRYRIDEDLIARLERAFERPAGIVRAALLLLALTTPDEPSAIALATPEGTHFLAPMWSWEGHFAEVTFSLASPDAPLRGAVLIGGADVPGARWILSGGDLTGDVDDPLEVERIGARLVGIVSRLAADPSTPMGLLLTAPLAERAELDAWGTGGAREVTFATASDDVRRHAARTPDRVAIACGEVSWTYAELDAWVDGIVAGLSAHGVERGHRVAVALDRSALMVAVMLGIWRMGAAYVPIDIAYPVDRIRFMLADAECQLLVHQDLELGREATPTWNIRVEPPTASVRGQDDVGDLRDDLAYIIYTSGSTGRPKGVEVTFAPLRNTIVAKVELLAMGSEDRQVAVMSSAFDASIFELTMPILSGGTLTVASKREVEDFTTLRALLERVRPTVLAATPMTWHSLIELGWRPTADLRAMVGGETLSSELAQRLAQFCTVYNMYGLTETAITSTAFRVDRRRMNATAPIGRPFANVTARVLRRDGSPARVEEDGELVVGGVGLARGYRKLDAMTDTRFVDDPRADPPAKMFRTGDIARFRADGELEFRGRGDTQVKIRGMRIELSEVENVLALHPGVAQVVVDVRGEGARAGLVAYVVAKQAPVPSEELWQLARARLAGHMVPYAVVAIGEVPLSFNGKVDRRKLPDPPSRASTTPAGDGDGSLEGKVVAAFEAALGCSCDPTTRFEEIGLDSLGRARVKQALAARGLPLELSVLFAESYVGGVIERLRGVTPAHPVEPVAARAARSPGEERPIVTNQKFPMLTHLANPGTGAWNCQISLCLSGPISKEIVARAWRRVVARHGALRLAFLWRGRPFPVQREAPSVTPEVHVFEHDPAQGIYAAFLRRTQEDELRTTFEMERPPLHRLALMTAPNGTFDVVWTYFSGLLDGWSSAIVIRDFVRFLRADVDGREVHLAAAPAYFDHLDAMAARDWSSSVAYLVDVLGDYRIPKPLGRPLGGSEDERATKTLEGDVKELFESLNERPFRTRGVGSKSARLSLAETSELAAATKRMGIAASTLLQSAWALTLMKEHGGHDVLIGMVAANRPDYEAAVGKYTSLLPFRYQAHRGVGLSDWLRANEGATHQILAHEGVPAALWTTALGFKPWEFPFASTFTYVNYGRRRPAVEMSAVEVRSSHQIDAGIPPMFGMVVIPGDETIIRLEYNQSVDLQDEHLQGIIDTFRLFVRLLARGSETAEVTNLLEDSAVARTFGVPLALV